MRAFLAVGLAAWAALTWLGCGGSFSSGSDTTSSSQTGAGGAAASSAATSTGGAGGGGPSCAGQVGCVEDLAGKYATPGNAEGTGAAATFTGITGITGDD